MLYIVNLKQITVVLSVYKVYPSLILLAFTYSINKRGVHTWLVNPDLSPVLTCGIIIRVKVPFVLARVALAHHTSPDNPCSPGQWYPIFRDNCTGAKCRAMGISRTGNAGTVSISIWYPFLSFFLMFIFTMMTDNITYLCTPMLQNYSS